jgi:hypothetical protein
VNLKRKTRLFWFHRSAQENPTLQVRPWTDTHGNDIRFGHLTQHFWIRPLSIFFSETRVGPNDLVEEFTESCLERAVMLPFAKDSTRAKKKEKHNRTSL